MEAVGSSNSVSILVLFDSSGYGGDTYLYRVEEGTSISIDVPWLDSEENMGEPQTIVDFVTWAVEHYQMAPYADADIGIASEAQEPNYCWHYTEPLMALRSYLGTAVIIDRPRG